MGLFGEADGPATVSVPVRVADLEIVVPAKGELESTNASPIAVPRVPTGALTVKELADEGSIVEPGEVVIVFDDTKLNIELDNHKATFRSTDREIHRNDLQSRIESGSIEVMRRVAELERDNVEAFQIVDDTIYSQREILEDSVRKDDAEGTIVYADAALVLRGEYYDIEERILDVARGQVDGKIQRVNYSLGQLVLKTPIGGMVVYKKNWRGGSVAIGDSLWPGNVVLQIVDPAQIALRGFVLERDAAGLQVGAEATIAVDARANRTYRGKVISVAEVSRPIERGSPVKYYEVKIDLEDGEPELLRPGMKGEARISLGRVEQALIVPRSAVRLEGEQPYVWVETAGGQERRDVELGSGDIVQVSIVEGLREGERVLLGGEPGEGPSQPSGPAVAGLVRARHAGARVSQGRAQGSGAPEAAHAADHAGDHLRRRRGDLDAVHRCRRAGAGAGGDRQDGPAQHHRAREAGRSAEPLHHPRA